MSRPSHIHVYREYKDTSLFEITIRLQNNYHVQKISCHLYEAWRRRQQPTRLMRKNQNGQIRPPGPTLPLSISMYEYVVANYPQSAVNMYKINMHIRTYRAASRNQFWYMTINIGQLHCPPLWFYYIGQICAPQKI